MNCFSIRFFSIFFILFLLPVFGNYEVRIGDLVFVNGIKKNVVTGYGLVVGLNGTGDRRNRLTRNAINQYLEFVGVKSEIDQLNTRNAAAVAVSAELNGLYEKGDLANVQVASICDAQSIDNGLLLQTVLKSANGDNYVVASGVVNVSPGSRANNTRGQIIGGGIIEKPIENKENLEKKSELILNLKSSSIQNLHHIKEIITEKYVELDSTIINYKKVRIYHKRGEAISFKTLSELFDEVISVSPSAKIVIDKNSGIVVAANNVKIDSAFISLPIGNIDVRDEDKLKINNVLKNNTTIVELAEEFNKLGISPDNIVSIFTALKKSGAINADIITQ